jgi:hypothetical protein
MSTKNPSGAEKPEEQTVAGSVAELHNALAKVSADLNSKMNALRGTTVFPVPSLDAIYAARSSPDRLAEHIFALIAAIIETRNDICKVRTASVAQSRALEIMATVLAKNSQEDPFLRYKTNLLNDNLDLVEATHKVLLYQQREAALGAYLDGCTQALDLARALLETSRGKCGNEPKIGANT